MCGPTGRRSARSGETARCGLAAVAARGESRQLPLDFLGLAIRALQVPIEILHTAQLFEIAAALAAVVFVQRHRYLEGRRRMTLPISSGVERVNEPCVGAERVKGVELPREERGFSGAGGTSTR